MITRIVLTLVAILGLLFVVVFLIYLKATIINGWKASRQLVKYNNIKLGHLDNFEIKTPYQGQGKYYKAQLHTHTTCSDGKLTPEELVKEYRKRGFSFLAITDHDSITEIASSFRGMVLIKGEELTWARPVRPFGYHLNRLFVDKPLTGKKLQNIIDDTAQAGGVVVINHPGFLGSLGSQRWLPAGLLKIRNYGLLEVVNHHTDTGVNLQYWHAVLKHLGPEKPVWGIAGDDCHTREEVGLNYIMVRVTDISERALKKALEKGDFYLTQGPEVEFTLEKDLIVARVADSKKANYKVCFIDADFKIIKSVILNTVKEREVHYKPVGCEGFIRIEVEDKDTGQRAWSQPFWLVEAGGG